MTATTRVRRARHTISDIFHERTNFNFIERSWRWALLSGTLLLIAAIGLIVGGLNLGIDFTGGVSYTVDVKGSSAPSVNTVRDTLKAVGQSDATVSLQTNRINGAHSIVVQTPSVSTAKRDQVQTALSRYGSVSVPVAVSATWGDTVTSKALLALAVFFGLIALYLTFRFEWRMAVAAIIAVIHDILLTVGVYAVTGFQVVPATVIAFLTILGFSLYDTVVVFDKVGENTPTVGTDRADTYSKMVNRSLNQVLMRSLNTSFVAVLPVASLVFVGSGLFGATALKDFAVALFVGLATGAYSSIFVAAPILAWLKEREPRYRAVRLRSMQQAARQGRDPGDDPAERAPEPVGAPPTSAPASGPGPGSAPDERPAAPPAPLPGPAARPGPSGTMGPRPRQQRRRKRR
ncbi:MAG TPA: protein translocase subunit SecF [Acidimicrobiia bacterium]|nr:protein translocase subunit SecF [Acidimicrobiia bacterium]